MRKQPIDEAISSFYDTLSSEEDQPRAHRSGRIHGSAGARRVRRTLRRSTAASPRSPRTGVWSACPAVDRNILRLAVYEMSDLNTPAPVVIDEALELARQFSGDESVSFINGVLDAVHREQRRESASRSAGRAAKSFEYRRGGAGHEQFRILRAAAGESVRGRVPRSAFRGEGAARARAALANMRTLAEAVADCALVVGTTSRGPRALEHPLRRLELGGKAIARKLATAPVALLFGSREIRSVQRRSEPLPLADAHSHARGTRIDEPGPSRGRVPVRDRAAARGGAPAEPKQTGLPRRKIWSGSRSVSKKCSGTPATCTVPWKDPPA